MGSSPECSYCGYFKVWGTCEAVVQTNTPWILLGTVCLSVHTLDHSSGSGSQTAV